MKNFFLLFFLVWGNYGLAARDHSWQFSSTTRLWLKGGITTLQDNLLIADPSPLALPKQSYGLLIQEDFTAKKPKLVWVFRPSLGTLQETYSLYPEKERFKKNKTEGRVNELYFLSEINERWTHAVGLQNYQWGPAELFSPSNPLFHFSSQAQEPSYRAPGHSLYRLNYTPDENWNFILLYEFAANEEKAFIYKSNFVPKGLIKAEYKSAVPTDYIGVSFGNEQMHDPFIGEYGNLNLDEEFSIYFDMKQTSTSKRYYPHVDYGQLPRMNLFDYHNSVYLLSLVGFRYETEYVDFRWEEITNEIGFSSGDINKISLSFAPGNDLTKNNMEAFLHNGREFVSKNYSYISLRSKKVIQWLDSTVSLRGLYSHRDQSSLGALQWDGSIGDHVTFFINAQANFGKEGSEMTLLYKNKANAGLQWIF